MWSKVAGMHQCSTFGRESLLVAGITSTKALGAMFSLAMSR